MKKAFVMGALLALLVIGCSVEDKAPPVVHITTPEANQVVLMGTNLPIEVEVEEHADSIQLVILWSYADSLSVPVVSGEGESLSYEWDARYLVDEYGVEYGEEYVDSAGSTYVYFPNYGRVTILADAWDEAGNRGTSDAVAVVVDNGAPVSQTYDGGPFNVIFNGGFETGNLDWWTTAGTDVSCLQVSSNVYCTTGVNYATNGLVLLLIGQEDFVSDSLVYDGWDLFVNWGDTMVPYEFSFWANKKNVVVDSTFAELWIEDENGNTLGEILNTLDLPDDMWPRVIDCEVDTIVDTVANDTTFDTLSVDTVGYAWTQFVDTVYFTGTAHLYIKAVLEGKALDPYDNSYMAVDEITLKRIE